jgi:hypothetical protein
VPTYPTSPLVNFAVAAYGAVAPGQVGYLQTRVAAWRNANSLSTGAQALAGTLGERLSSGSVATDSVRRFQPPHGVARYT